MCVFCTYTYMYSKCCVNNIVCLDKLLEYVSELSFSVASWVLPAIEQVKNFEVTT